ncbi:MAG TPA: UDP-N-acetylmuramate--L-alanine ligase [Microbacteriaceae bacterium]|nr:UDP-N-acetylmuramate--L-alanine ligase [Microbacteriaceae bacterium]
MKPDPLLQLPESFGSVHFVGIGGSGMAGIARLFVASGHRVTGSDVRESHNVDAMRALGVPVEIGHSAAHLGDAEAVVVTGALWQDNPEYQTALKRGIPVLHRSQALAWLANSQRLVAVAGAHGKTTSTGMVITGLLEAGRSPSFVNGGVIAALGTSSSWGTDAEFVVEADESDGSFLLYNTAIALITNVDADHLDHYGSHEEFDAAFVAFADGATEAVIISSDDAGAQRVRERLTHRSVVTFGEAADADVRVTDIESSGGRVRARVHVDGETVELDLAIPGRHNAVNAAGALAVLRALGVAPADAAVGLRAFGGTERRFELHDVRREVAVYDDYAHHPTEVAAALSAARTVVGAGRIIAVHQPHTYSRTAAFAREFAAVLETHAEHTIVLDVYGAREDPVPGVTGALVSEAFSDASKVAYLPDWEAAAAEVARIARPGDFVITLGCGDVYRIIPQILSALES